MARINVNDTYELYQIITDFGDPLEVFREAFQNAYDEGATEVFCHIWERQQIGGEQLIIDIWNNGAGLPVKNVSNFFDLANSTKVGADYRPQPGKIGYKGHGAKIFFNAESVIILSKTPDNEWACRLDDPIGQIQEEGNVSYSEILEPNEVEIDLPADWGQGFFVRIVGHRHFRTQHTKFKLNHLNVRDYVRWFTVFGSLRPILNGQSATSPVLHLRGLSWDGFVDEYCNPDRLDPLPITELHGAFAYEQIVFGHFLPPERKTEKQMKDYAQSLNSTRPYYEFYSKTAYNQSVTCSDGTTFHLLIHLEGYETKRKYDPLLTGRGKPRTDISHADSERYGLWACKGGVPVEKIDGWLEGKGTYSFMQAFVDSDEFDLTANRGSIHNTDIERLAIIKSKVNEIFSSATVAREMNERLEIERFEKQLQSIEQDGANLKKRFKAAEKRPEIKLPGGRVLRGPSKLSNGYSESETLVLLVQIMTIYPDLFEFRLLDYNTRDGIDCVVEYQHAPQYIELKGTLGKSINHPFRYIRKFICYECSLTHGDQASDLEDFVVTMQVNAQDSFASPDPTFRGKQFRSRKLTASTVNIADMEVIELKTILTNVIGATIDT